MKKWLYSVQYYTVLAHIDLVTTARDLLISSRTKLT